MNQSTMHHHPFFAIARYRHPFFDIPLNGSNHHPIIDVTPEEATRDNLVATQFGYEDSESVEITTTQSIADSYVRHVKVVRWNGVLDSVYDNMATSPERQALWLLRKRVFEVAVAEGEKDAVILLSPN